jgi:glycosyltransferase involved in cell wall biosynthesis
MKVLHLIDSLNRGGAEILTLDIARNAAASDIDICVVATGGGDLEEEFESSEFEYIRLQRKLPVDPSIVLALRKIIDSKGIQVVHVQEPVMALHGYLATPGLKTKLVCSHQGWYEGRKNRIVLKYLAPRIDMNITPSHDMKEWLRSKGYLRDEIEIKVIANGVDQKRLECNSRNLRAELRLGDDDLLAGMLANFYHGVRKDHQTVCRSLAKLTESHPHLHVAFVGGRDDQAPQVMEDCKQLCHRLKISDRVHFLGKRSDIPDILNSFDLFVLSSFHEGVPIALIGAMIVGLPCIASDIAPHCEISAQGEAVRLFKTGDADALACALSELVSDKAARDALGMKGRNHALSEFSIEAHLARVRSVYQSLVG